MPDYMINIAMAVLATLFLTRWIIRKYIEKNILCFIAAEMALLIGIKFFSGSVMAVWSLLVLESYIDITEQQIFCVPTWLLIGIEIIYMLNCLQLDIGYLTDYFFLLHFFQQYNSPLYEEYDCLFDK